VCLFYEQLESPELKLSGPDKLGRVDYFKHLGNAKFCLAPRGESSWTLRFYESFFVVSSSSQKKSLSAYCIPTPSIWVSWSQFWRQECVPVLLSDEVELPFQNVIDYTEISIKWPSSKIGPELFQYLESIPGTLPFSLLPSHCLALFQWASKLWNIHAEERVEEMIARGREMRCMWVYGPDTEPCSAMTAIMWELQRKVRRFHQSAQTFWLHNTSIVNRDLLEFHQWRTPIPLPWHSTCIYWIGRPIFFGLF
jgi:hypothetical protein